LAERERPASTPAQPAQPRSNLLRLDAHQGKPKRQPAKTR
jgi:hypothetical protein